MAKKGAGMSALGWIFSRFLILIGAVALFVLAQELCAGWREKLIAAALELCFGSF